MPWQEDGGLSDDGSAIAVRIAAEDDEVDAVERRQQAILETLDTGDRVRKVAESLALQRMALAHDPMDIN